MKKVYIITISVLLTLLSSSCTKSAGQGKCKFAKQTDTTSLTAGEINGVSVLEERVAVKNFVADEYLVDDGLDDDAPIIYPTTDNTRDIFTVEEFTKYDETATDETIQKIKEIHIPELVKVRNVIGEPIIIRSAARSYEHEKKWGAVGKVNTSTQTEKEQ